MGMLKRRIRFPGGHLPSLTCSEINATLFFVCNSYTLAIKLAVSTSLLVHSNVGMLISNILYNKHTLCGELPVILPLCAGLGIFMTNCANIVFTLQND